MRLIIGLMAFSQLLLASPQGVPALTSTTVGVTSTVALAANPYRGYLIMQNQGPYSCVMAPASSVVSPNGILVLSGQNYELQQAFIKSAISVQCGGSSSRIVFLEANF